MDAPIGQHSDYPLGQLVELVNQPPNYGRSLDGTLARVAWVPRPKQWAGLVMVEFYRRHRRTRKPLALRMSLMAVGQLRLITQPTADQLRLLEEVEPLRQEQASRRQQLKGDRLAWEERILSMANHPVKTATKAYIPSFEPLPGAQGPPGPTPAAVEGLKKRGMWAEEDPATPATAPKAGSQQRSQAEILAAQHPSPPPAPELDSRAIGLAMRGVAELELLLARQPPQGATAADVTSFFSRQRSTLVDALAELLGQFAGEPPKPEPLQSSAQLQSDVASLIEEGNEFALHVQGGGEHYTFVVTPDFDGIYVSLGHAGEVRKLASTVPDELLHFIPTVWPHVAGGEVLAVSDDLALTEACSCKLHGSARVPAGSRGDDHET